MLPAQQKNSKISSQQVVAKAKEDLKKQLQIKKIDPKMVANLGHMATQAIKDKSIYPMVIQQAQKLNLIGKNLQSGFDYKILSQIVAGGKLAEMIMKEGV